MSATLDGRRTRCTSRRFVGAVCSARASTRSTTRSGLLQRPVARFAFVPGGDRVVWERDRDLGIASVSDTTFETALTSTDYWEGMPAVSPDGRWLAYYSNESGSVHVYVRPLSGQARPVQVSRDAGLYPRWSRSGRSLFVLNGRTLTEARLEPGDRVTVSSLIPLFDLPRPGSYDVLPGDSLFVTTWRPVSGESAPGITIITNVDVLLRRLEAASR